MRKIVLIILLSTIGLFVIVGITKAALTFYEYKYYSIVRADHSIFEYGCIPRPGVNGGNWYILNNATHAPEGCTSITTYHDKIQVHLDNCLDKVITAYAIPDEKFAQAGITPGLMMGQCEWTIWMYNRQGDLIDPTTLSTTNMPGANLWLWVRGTD